MGKEVVLNSLNYKKNLLRNARSRLATLNEQYDTLVDLSSRCQTRTTSFSNSIAQRNSRLLRLEGFLGQVKSAKRFKEKMFDLLNGREYSSATGSINSLVSSISAKKQTVIQNINDTEDEIARLQADVDRLQYEYDTYPEEVCTDGEC